MKAKKKAPEKVKASPKKGKKLGMLDGQDIHAVKPGSEHPPASHSEEIPAGLAEMEAVYGKGPEPEVVTTNTTALAPPLTAPPLTLVTDTAILFWRGAEELTAQLLGQPESAIMLARVYEWEGKLKKLKKLLVGDEDAVEGLKKHVLDNGQPWGDKGSKQMTLAGVVVKVKAVNYRSEPAPLTIADLDEKKVEAYLRGVPWEQPIEQVLASLMKPVTVWTLKDLPPQQTKNLNAMLADPGEDGQGLRQCLKDTKYQMMAPEMENET